MVKVKKKCIRCKDNYVSSSTRRKYVVCYECEKKELDKPIDDPEMKKFFDIPEELYKESRFLRDIKKKYLRYGELSDKQKETFKKVAKEMQE